MPQYTNIFDYPTFTDSGVYVLVAIARKKDNDHVTDSAHHITRRVVVGREQLKENYKQLREQFQGPGLTYRIYLSVNRRDAMSAGFSLRDKINRWIQEMLLGNDHTNKFRKLDSVFKSVLQDPAHKDQGNFLIDVDNPDDGDVESVWIALTHANPNTNILYETETPNGYHYIVEGFNPTTLNVPDGIDVEIKRDAMIYLDTV